MDKEILHKVYAEHIHSLYDYGFKLCGDKDLVTDEIQNLFLYLFEKDINPENIQHKKAYLLSSLRRRIFKSLYAKNKFRSTDEVFTDFNLDYSIESRIIDNEMDEEISQKLKDAFQCLSPRQKEIIHLKYFESLTNEEICEAMDLSDQAVRNLLSNTLRKLRDNYPNTSTLASFLLV